LHAVREAGIEVGKIVLQTNGLHFFRADSSVLETEIRALMDLGVTGLEFTGFGPNQVGQILPAERMDRWAEEYADVIGAKLVALGLSVTSYGYSSLVTTPGKAGGPLAGSPLHVLLKTSSVCPSSQYANWARKKITFRRAKKLLLSRT
jgi:hypothetical protein